MIVQEVERHKQSDFSGIFAAIRRAVAGEHELAPDAIVLIKAGSIPKTSSGKIQRHACRESYLAGTLDVVGQWRPNQPMPRWRGARGREAARPPELGRGRRCVRIVLARLEERQATRHRPKRAIA